MATFSILSIACLPATVVSGIFGMNVKVPYMVNDDSTTVAFAVIVIILALAVVFVYTVFHFLVFKR
jgi:Mg2+ and Co2+ transporter CorA